MITTLCRTKAGQYLRRWPKHRFPPEWTDDDQEHEQHQSHIGRPNAGRYAEDTRLRRAFYSHVLVRHTDIQTDTWRHTDRHTEDTRLRRAFYSHVLDRHTESTASFLFSCTRQTHRHTGRHRDIQTDRHIDRHTGRYDPTQADMQRTLVRCKVSILMY